MPDDLLGTARRQAENADPSTRAAALLRIARAETAEDVSRARKTLLEGLDVVRNLPSSEHRHLFEEARSVAAAVSPELLDEIPITRPEVSSNDSHPATLFGSCLPMVTVTLLSITCSTTRTRYHFHSAM